MTSRPLLFSFLVRKAKEVEVFETDISFRTMHVCSLGCWLYFDITFLSSFVYDLGLGLWA